MPSIWDMIPAAAGQALNWWNSQPSWLERAAAVNAQSDPTRLRPSQAEIDFASGMLGAAPTKAIAPMLAMDEASRMARATAQGFTRDAYRGEGAPIVGQQFIEGHPSRYDTGYLGGDAIYSTNAPRLANDYASFKAYKLRPDDEAQNVMPLRVKLDNPKIIPGEEKKRIAQLPQHERDAWLRDVYKSGHDGVIVKYNGGYEEYAAPATQYRSRFAAFDPKSSGSANLLGSIAALMGLGVGGLAGNRNEP